MNVYAFYYMKEDSFKPKWSGSDIEQLSKPQQLT